MSTGNATERKLAELEYWTTWPEWAADAVITDVDICLGWRDLLTLLWRCGRMGVSIKAFTEHQPGRVQSVQRVIIRPICPPWRQTHTFGVVTEDAP